MTQWEEELSLQGRYELVAGIGKSSGWLMVYPTLVMEEISSMKVCDLDSTPKLLIITMSKGLSQPSTCSLLEVQSLRTALS